MIAGLIALDRRNRGAPPLPEDDDAIAGLVARVNDRSAMARVAGGFVPENPDAYQDVASDVLLRLVTAAETVLAPIAARLGVDRAEAIPAARRPDADRIAARYVGRMLHRRAIDRHRRRGARLADPMRDDDPRATLDGVADPAGSELARAEAEDHAFAARCREGLDAVARRVVETRSLKDFAASYDQLWRLADGAATLDDLARDTGLAEAALHQRHKRARTALLEVLEDEARRGALDLELIDPIQRIVTEHLRRRQTPAPERVSPTVAPPPGAQR